MIFHGLGYATHPEPTKSCTVNGAEIRSSAPGMYKTLLAG